MPTGRAKLLTALLAGVIAGAVAGLLGAGPTTPLLGWDILALVFLTWIWLAIGRLDPESTAQDAKREEPGRDLTDLVLLGAALASLIAVGVVLVAAGHHHGTLKYAMAGLAVVSVIVSWTLIHTVYTLKYARLYYSGVPGGIGFNQSSEPDYRDFAYLAFTIGMTFQVSDTNIESKPVRRTALRHALLSFPMGVVIIATTINLVSGLAK